MRSGGSRGPRSVELGITTFCVDQERGGLGARVDAAVTTATELGAALHGSPYAGLTAGARALTRQHTPAVDDLATRVADGDEVCAWGRVDATGRTARLVDGAGDADTLPAARSRPRAGPAPAGRPGCLVDRRRGTGLRRQPPRPGRDVRPRGGARRSARSDGRGPARSAPRRRRRRVRAADARPHRRRYAGERQHLRQADRRVPGRAAPPGRPHHPRPRAWRSSWRRRPASLGDGSPEPRARSPWPRWRELAVPSHVLHDLLQLTGGDRLHVGARAALLRAPRAPRRPARRQPRPCRCGRCADLEGWTHGMTSMA